MRTASVLIGLAVGLLAGACATPASTGPVFQSGQLHAELQLDEGDDGRTIGVSPGSIFTVSLPEDQGGGVEWALQRAPDPSIVGVLKPRSMGGGQEPGVAGRDVWTFRALGSGTTTVVLAHGEQQFQLIVSVT